jgi:hypothetical protein
MKRMNHLCGTVLPGTSGLTLTSRPCQLKDLPIRRRVQRSERSEGHAFGRFAWRILQGFICKIGQLAHLAKEKSNGQLTNA